MGYLARLRRNPKWSIALHVEDEPLRLTDRIRSKPRLLVSPAPVIRGRGHIMGFADPFLFVKEDELYLFYEVDPVGEPARIEARRTRDLINFENLGIVLSTGRHTSYPFVFETPDGIFMLPETAESGELSLYRFKDFPHQLVRERVLLRGRFVDSSILHHEGRWYLFTTSEVGLELFVTDDLLRGELVRHPASPVTNDPAFRRSGGPTRSTRDGLFRLAQDCSVDYGRNLNVLQILELTPSTYREKLLRSDFFARSDEYNECGAHHLSVIEFMGKTVIAVDGYRRDGWGNSAHVKLVNFSDRFRSRTPRASPRVADKPDMYDSLHKA